MRRVLVSSLLFASLLCGCGSAARSTAPTTSGPATPGEASPQAEALFALVNGHRAGLGLSTLAWHPGAALAAQRHADDMVTRGYFSHETPEGVDPFERLAAAGVPYASAGENIGEGYTEAQAVLDAWLASPTHRANLEDPGFTRQGIGYRAGVWTHEFVTPP